MYFRFTLFNSVTLFIMAATLLMAFARFRFRLDSNWFLLYYLLIVAYWFAFDGALNTWWVAFGVVVALVLRLELTSGRALVVVRAAELAFFGYVLWRGLGLLLLWPW